MRKHDRNHCSCPIALSLCVGLALEVIAPHAIMCLLRPQPPETIACDVAEVALPHTETPDLPSDLTFVLSKVTSGTAVEISTLDIPPDCR
jgi:hypothetical protein